MAEISERYSGGCGCGQLRYQMKRAPLIVHCCHCLECQKQTGSAYVLNAIVETDQVELQGNRTEHTLPTPSGKGQIIIRCADCGTAVASRYMLRLGKLSYVRVGTLDDPAQCPPDVQIFTCSKQPWVPLSADIPVFSELYRFEDVWSEDALARFNAVFEQ